MTDLSGLCGGQTIRNKCSDYPSAEEAQTAFDNQEPGTKYLDGDNDGVVCEWNK